jgi:hypothetical protein
MRTLDATVQSIGVECNKLFRRRRVFMDRQANVALVVAALLISIGLAPAALALPTCSQFGTDPAYGLAGNPQIVAGTLTAAIIPPAGAVAPNPPSQPTATPATPAYCQVNFTYASGLAGPADGYDVGQVQKIKIRVSLPLSAADGGAGGAQGNWVGKQMTSASAGASGSVTSWANYAEGLNHDTGPVYAIRLGYVGSSTDTGQGNPPFGVIQTGQLAHTLALGTIDDWTHRATHYGKQWAGTLAQAYYGTAPTRVYYNGCSGGANMGMGQLQNYADEYDGFLIGAPAYFWQEFRLADAWPALVLRKLALQKGNVAAPIAAAQISAANAAATAACDAADGVVDGIVADPRACTWSATNNICGKPGAPAAPNCLDADQAAAIDRIWDGPRNSLGKRIWNAFDRGINFSASTNTPGSTTQVIQWNHADTTFAGSNLYADQEAIDLAAGAGIDVSNAITYENEAYLGSHTTNDYTDNFSPALDKARAHGTKIVQVHGTIDGAIRWRTDVDYYRRVAQHFSRGVDADFDSLQQWYRLFPMPGVGHCTGGLGGGTGPSPVDPFLALVKWVENGIAPDSILAMGGAGAPPTRTRPLCPFPQTAIYNGSGSTDVAANFHCGGNLETTDVVCDELRTRYKNETGGSLDTNDIGVRGQGACHRAN